jgi:hypothetical protein
MVFQYQLAVDAWRRYGFPKDQRGDQCRHALLPTFWDIRPDHSNAFSLFPQLFPHIFLPTVKINSTGEPPPSVNKEFLRKTIWKVIPTPPLVLRKCF